MAFLGFISKEARHHVNSDNQPPHAGILQNNCFLLAIGSPPPPLFLGLCFFWAWCSLLFLEKFTLFAFAMVLYLPQKSHCLPHVEYSEVCTRHFNTKLSFTRGDATRIVTAGKDDNQRNKGL